MVIRMPPRNLIRRTLCLVSLCLLLPALAGCGQNSGCDLVRVAQTPIRVRNGALIVEVSINGHATRMLLDTGASRSLVSEPAKQRLGLVEDGRFMTAHVGIGATTMQADVSIDSMTIGATPLSVERMGVGAISDGLVADGLLGMDILGAFDLDIDQPKRLLSLYRVRRCETADPPWDEPAIPIPGITTRYGLLRMPLEIDGIEAAALIDTGASVTIIRQPMAHRLGLTEQALANDQVAGMHGAGGGSSPTYIHRFQSVVIGSIQERNVRIHVLMVDPQVMPNGNPMDENLIGQDFLGNRRIWFSFETQRVAVSQRPGDEQTHQ
jgi:predicted aspartyl protease